MFLKDQFYMTVLANENSLTQAAAKLNISQPALSKWLNHLESELGTPLVIRSRRGLIFTESGQIYLEGCRACMEVARNVRNELDALFHNSAQTIILGGSRFAALKPLPKYSTNSADIIPILNCNSLAKKTRCLKNFF